MQAALLSSERRVADPAVALGGGEVGRGRAGR